MGRREDGAEHLNLDTALTSLEPRHGWFERLTGGITCCVVVFMNLPYIDLMWGGQEGEGCLGVGGSDLLWGSWGCDERGGRGTEV